MTKIVFSGFGGQGILTLGGVVANVAMLNNKQVTWMPSYGAEMRGGTANCSVIVSDKVIGSPIVQSGIDILCAMNGPSLDKFLPRVKPGGIIFVNSSIVHKEVDRDDVKVILVDATNVATSLGDSRVQNMVMLAGVLKALDLYSLEDVKSTFQDKFGERYPKLIPLNMNAVKRGEELVDL